LDGRVVPSTVSGDVLTIHRGDYLMGSASGAGGDFGHVAGLGSKLGGTEEGDTPIGGRGGISGEV
jgi:hypothetical protein